VFIFFGAGQENAEAQARTMLTTQRVGDAYNKHALTLAVGDRVGKVIDYMLTSYQPDFAVLQGRRLLGVVSREDVLRALASAADEDAVPDMDVTTIMRRDVVGVDADATLDDIRRVMGQNGVRLVAVHDGATYLGLVASEDLAEAYAVLQAVEKYRARRDDPAWAT
jgi:CBS domain-containing protein